MIPIKATARQKKMWKHYLSIKFQSQSERKDRLALMIKWLILNAVSDEMDKEIKLMEEKHE